jgi:hypothetical protein
MGSSHFLNSCEGNEYCAKMAKAFRQKEFFSDEIDSLHSITFGDKYGIIQFK